MISASIRFLRTPFRSEALVAIAEGRKPPPVTGATAPHLALGPRPRPRSRPLLLSEYPREHLGPAPSYPGAGHVYRLRTVVRRGSGLRRAQPHSRPAPLIRCRRRHRRWAQRAAGIALHLPPWPPPPPPALAKDPALRRRRRRSHRRRYRVPRAPARRAASSPATSGLPRPVSPTALDRLSPPPSCYYSRRQTNFWSCEGSSYFPLGRVAPSSTVT